MSGIEILAKLSLTGAELKSDRFPLSHETNQLTSRCCSPHSSAWLLASRRSLGEEHSSDSSNQREKSVRRLQAPTLLANFGPLETLLATPGQIRGMFRSCSLWARSRCCRMMLVSGGREEPECYYGMSVELRATR